MNAVLSTMDSPSYCVELIKESLSCAICKEVYKTPVLIKECSHNFCSICIRRYFVINQECPLCGTDASQGSLIPNRILESLFQRFDELRSLLSQEHQVTSTQAAVSTVIKAQEARRVPPQVQNDSRTPLSANCTSSSPDVSSRDSDCEIVETPDFSLGLKDFCTQSHSLSADTSQLCAMSKEMFPTPAKHQNEENIQTAVQQLSAPEKPEKRLYVSVEKLTAATTSLPIVEKPQVPATTKDEADCPVCGMKVLCSKMNPHLDNCLAREEKKSCLRRNAPKRQKPTIPVVKLAYNLLSMRALRQKLKELGLWTTGDKSTLIKRHQEFVAKYQAEQDKLKPRRTSILVEELQREEEERERCVRATRQRARKRVMLGHDLTTAVDTESQKKRYLEKHAEQFKVLEKQVKESLPLKRKRVESNTDSQSYSHPHAQSATDVEVCPDSQSSVGSLDSVVMATSTGFSTTVADNPESDARLSPELYLTPTANEPKRDPPPPNDVVIVASSRHEIEEDSQATQVKQFIDASLPGAFT